jgi:hypothetical protein
VASAAELLRDAASGRVGVDRRLVQAILDSPSAPEDTLAFARDSHKNGRVPLDPLLIDLFHHWGTPEALDFYLDAIRRNPQDVDDELIQALLPFGGKALEPLLQLYEELGEEQGSDVAFVLAGLHVRDPRVLAVLLDRLEFDAADGAFCLGLYGDEAARPALEKMLAEIPESETDLRREISYALDQLGAAQPEYRPEPFDILKQYPDREMPAFDVLTEPERIELLASPDAQIRAGAAHSFFNSELSPTAKQKLFELAQNDPEPGVRGRAWESLADAVQDAKVREALLAALRDTSRAVEERGGAAVGLYGAADRDDARAGIEALYEEGGKARVKALEAMWRSLWQPYSKYFAQHLDASDVALVREALRGAGYFQLTSQADKIASYFDREGQFADLREDALFAYALAMPGETTRGRARGMLRRINALTHLSPSEAELVMFGLDERLRLKGLAPVFEPEGEVEEETEPTIMEKVGRNDPCPCGSGKKYKKCHGS